MTATRTPTVGRKRTVKKKCGGANCGDLATHVALSSPFCVYLCDRCFMERRPKGDWKFAKLTEPGACTYLEAP